MRERVPLIYAMSTGKGYGMQEMAYATLSALRDEFEPVVLVPPGPAVHEARALGFTVVETLPQGSHEVGGITSVHAWNFSARLRPYFARHKRLAFFGTRCMHTLVFAALNLRYRRRVANFHIVHGVEDDDRWGQKRALDRFPFPITVIAVSDFAREKMQAHGLRRPVRVIDNFLTDARVAAMPHRAPSLTGGVRRAAVVSRLDPVKRLDVLLQALEEWPQLHDIAFHVYGDGSESAALRARAEARGLNIVFEGFRSDVPLQLAQADLLVHTGPAESLPVALLEAMAVGLPILGPDSGGAACVVENGVSGLHFRANDASSLGARLVELRAAEPARLAAFVAGGRAALATRFSERERLAEYRAAVWASLGERPEERGEGEVRRVS